MELRSLDSVLFCVQIERMTKSNDRSVDDVDCVMDSENDHHSMWTVTLNSNTRFEF